jgi:hypothetical protein
MHSSAKMETGRQDELDEREMRNAFGLVDRQLQDNEGAVEVWTEPLLVRSVEHEREEVTGRTWIEKTTIWFGIHEFDFGFRLAVREVRSLRFTEGTRRLRFGYKESIAQVTAADLCVRERAFRALPGLLATAARRFRQPDATEGGKS